MVFGVPVAGQNSEFSGRRRERDRNYRAAQDFETTEGTSGLVEGQGGEVKVAADLIFHLENISEILSWRDGTVCAINSILPRVPSLLNPIPTQQSRCKIVHFFQFTPNSLHLQQKVKGHRFQFQLLI